MTNLKSINKRDLLQKEWAVKYINYIKTSKGGILNIAPRVGKCRVTINIFKCLEPEVKILIAYPKEVIKKSWRDEFDLCNYNNKNITYTTHLSMKKYSHNTYDVIIFDEVHLLSLAQKSEAKKLIKNCINYIALSGTLSQVTLSGLKCELAMESIVTYSIEEAIQDRIITDYTITIHKCSLDKYVRKFNNIYTEAQQMLYLSNQIDKVSAHNGIVKLLRFARMRLIQNSIGKLNLTKKLLHQFKENRILIFCGMTIIADSLGCPSYHNNVYDKAIFERFIKGEGHPHLAVVKVGDTGITYKPLDMVLINYFDSNPENLAQKILRCMAYEYNNINKKANIHLVTTDEPIELKWLSNALEFFSPQKITYKIL